MKKSNLFFGSFLLLFSLFLYVTALSFPPDLVSATGPGFFPKIVAALLALLSGLLIRREVRAYRGTKVIAASVSWGNWKRVAAILLDMVIYVLLLDTAGFIISTFLFLTVILFLMEPTKKKWWLKVVIAVCLTAVVYLIFAVIFGASLPRGWMG